MSKQIVLSDSLERRAVEEAERTFQGDLGALVDVAVNFYLTLQGAMRQFVTVPAHPLELLDAIRILKLQPKLLEEIQRYFGGKRVELTDIESGTAVLPPEAIAFLASQAGLGTPQVMDPEEAVARSIAASDDATQRLNDAGPGLARIAARVAELRT